MTVFENRVGRSGLLSDTGSVLVRTYALLSATLMFSGVCSFFAMHVGAKPLNPLFMIISYFGLLFCTMRFKDCGLGLFFVFALTGFLGYTLGPVLDFYMHSVQGGSQILTSSLMCTGAIFLLLSCYSVVSRKDFSYLGGFLFIGISSAFVLGILALLFNWAMVNLLVSMLFVLFSSGYILFQTSLMVRGGERNAIVATVGLYVAIFNLFVSLLNVLSMFSGSRR